MSRREQGAVAGNAGRPAAAAAETAIQANWNASLEPDRLGGNDLRTTNFEQQGSELKNPLRRALSGYCPVELHESAQWVAGRPEYRATYRGQVFEFSSEAALRRFTAAPEKYVPAHEGNDPVLAVEEDRNIAGNIQSSAVWQGRLYLFTNSANLAAFREDPTRYVSRP